MKYSYEIASLTEQSKAKKREDFSGCWSLKDFETKQVSISRASVGIRLN